MKVKGFPSVSVLSFRIFCNCSEKQQWFAWDFIEIRFLNKFSWKHNLHYFHSLSSVHLHTTHFNPVVKVSLNKVAMVLPSFA
jgi:hypothetical protein